jgi:hypothetical protein
VVETTAKDLYTDGFDAQIKRWDKCVSVSGGYVEKWCYFFQVMISHVLHFLSIFDHITDCPP